MSSSNRVVTKEEFYRFLKDNIVYNQYMDRTDIGIVDSIFNINKGYEDLVGGTFIWAHSELTKWRSISDKWIVYLDNNRPKRVIRGGLKPGLVDSNKIGDKK